ncbi:MAG: single-stranded DNA-binding protein [Thermomicrobiales bacterium]|nr:single-stranded DNA-binding protein [Thermomicrobiales bacterium]
MASISKITLIGNLGRDPETRYTPSGKLNVQFTMAVNRKFRDQGGNLQDRTNWFRVTAWGTLAESMVKLAEQGWLAKGKLIYVEGRFEAREYQDRDGQTRTSLDVNATELQLLGSRGDAMDGEGGFGGRSGDFGGQGGGYQRGGQREAEGGEFGGPDDIDEVPF